MSDPDQPRDWTDIDDDTDPGTFVTAMQEIAGVGPIQRYKRRSHQLLHPKPGDRMLDVGCGPGHDVLMLAEVVGENGEVVGIDNSESMIETAREAASGHASVRFETDDALDLSFDDNSFDAARADRVLQHLESPTEAFEELRRVTRQGGWVGVSDTDWNSLFIDTPSGESEQFLSLEYAPTGTPSMGRQLWRMAKDMGLRDIEVLPTVVHDTDYTVLEQAVMLEDWTGAMVAANEVTQAQVDAWIAGLREADEKGRLLAGATVFTVAGRVPTAQ